MGKYRSKTGCLTCRARHIKCNEEHPVCRPCSKKNRTCRWDGSSIDTREYQPKQSLPSATHSRTDADCAGDDKDQSDGEDAEEGRLAFLASGTAVQAKSGSLTESRRDRQPTDSPRLSSAPLPPTASVATPAGCFYAPESLSYSSGSLSVSPSLPRNLSPRTQISLNRHEAVLIHHYTQYLGRWMDSTDASRQFTLAIPTLVKQCPILLHAVLAFSAKHCKDVLTAEVAYTRCISLLVERLQSENVMHDDSVLCAIAILRFVEQLDVSLTRGDSQHHLSGLSAILSGCQGPIVDPSVPTLRCAAFWAYARQCLWSATINQEPPYIDHSIRLIPVAHAFQVADPSSQRGRESAWANIMMWLCIRVLQFCFDGDRNSTGRDIQRQHQKRDELWDAVQRWNNERPASFDPIWSGPASETSVFPEVWFTADWHTIAFSSYHFSCILLITYKPAPRFATRSVGGKLNDSEHQILNHARQICGSCLCSPENVANLMTLCYSVFVWGPLMVDQRERNVVLELLTNFEKTHSWPTVWIVEALKTEWSMSS